MKQRRTRREAEEKRGKSSSSLFPLFVCLFSSFCLFLFLALIRTYSFFLSFFFFLSDHRSQRGILFLWWQKLLWVSDAVWAALGFQRNFSLFSWKFHTLFFCVLQRLTSLYLGSFGTMAFFRQTGKYSEVGIW